MESFTSTRRGVIAIGVAFVAALAAVALAFVLAPANATDSERSLSSGGLVEQPRPEIPLFTPEPGAPTVAPRPSTAGEGDRAKDRDGKARPASALAPICDRPRAAIVANCAPCAQARSDRDRTRALPCSPLPKPTCRQETDGARIVACIPQPTFSSPPKPTSKPTVWCLDQPPTDRIRGPRCPAPRTG